MSKTASPAKTGKPPVAAKREKSPKAAKSAQHAHAGGALRTGMRGGPATTRTSSLVAPFALGSGAVSVAQGQRVAKTIKAASLYLKEGTAALSPIRGVRSALSAWDDVFASFVSTGTFALSPESAWRLLNAGLPARLVPSLSDAFGLTKTELAFLMGLDRSTATRLSAGDKPVPMHCAESILRVMELQALASEVFGSQEHAKEWLSKKHPSLEGLSPFEVAKSSYGSQRVKDILLAIKYGGVV